LTGTAAARAGASRDAPAETPWHALIARFREHKDLLDVATLLEWDDSVCRPDTAAAPRARWRGLLERLAHERLVDPAIGALVDAALDDSALDADSRISVLLLSRDRERALAVPPSLAAALAAAQSVAYRAWVDARQANDFAPFAKPLERLLELKREHADAVGWRDERYDALLDEHEPGLTAKQAESLLTGLASSLQNVLGSHAARGSALVDTPVPEPSAQAFCRSLAVRLGFDERRGRIDFSPSPFATELGAGDARVSLPLGPLPFVRLVTLTLHEVGHALHFQGLRADDLDLPIATIRSTALLESQAKLWESEIGRSEAFACFLAEALRDALPESFAGAEAEDVAAALAAAPHTVARQRAGEAAAVVHVLVRFELERALVRGDLAVGDLRGAFDDLLAERIGTRPADARSGVLQDVQWAVGDIGSFPSYVLGSLCAAALLEGARSAVGDLDQATAAGDFSELRGWLDAHVWRHAGRFTAAELVERELGIPLGAEPYATSLRKRLAAAASPY
jgi:carboxypeptidase Taq